MHRRLAKLALVALLLAGCSRAPLYSDLSEQQANDVQAALLEAGIDADKTHAGKGDQWAVSVAKGSVPAAMDALHSRGLPRPPFDSMGKIFRKDGFVSSPIEERARYLYALSQGLERTLQQIDGVVEARVHIALPERDVLDSEPQSGSASVVIIQRPGADLRDRETDIKAIVMDGVEGLRDVNRVTVKFFARQPPIQRPTVAAANPLQSLPAGGLLAGGGVVAVAAAGLLLAQRRRRAWSQPLPPDAAG
jgi:type III secretion protein J